MNIRKSKPVIASPKGEAICFSKNQIASSACGLLAMTMLFIPSTFACPGCSDILTRGKDEAVKLFGFAQGINWTIIMMITIPYLLIGAFIFAVWRGARRRKNEAKHG